MDIERWVDALNKDNISNATVHALAATHMDVLDPHKKGKRDNTDRWV